jgi:hypothetical protein
MPDKNNSLKAALEALKKIDTSKLPKTLRLPEEHPLRNPLRLPGEHPLRNLAQAPGQPKPQPNSEGAARTTNHRGAASASSCGSYIRQMVSRQRT